MSFLLHILTAIWHRRITEFWPIWITMTVASALAVAWLVGNTAALPVQNKREAASTQLSAAPRSWGATVALILLAVLLTGYVAESLVLENFADGDNHFFTLGTLKGQDLELKIWPDQGRFFPLGHQEFNLIRRFTDSVVGYHVLPLALLLSTSVLLLFLDDGLSTASRAGLAVIILVLPSMVVSFTELVIPERSVVFFLVCLLFFVKLFEQTQSTKWAVAATVSAQFMIYFKETACLLLLAFAVGRLFFRCWRPDRVGLDFSRLRDKDSRLDLCFISLAILFLLYYLAAMFPHLNMKYADQQRVSVANTFLYYIKLDLLAWFLVATGLTRIYLILKRSVTALPFWDGLALGGITCFAAYLYLRLTSPYYLAPVDLIAVLYVGRFVILSWRNMRSWSRAAVFALVLVVLFQILSFSAFVLYERKNTIYAKAEMADVIVSQYRSGTNKVPRLFFPFASAYEITEFASYLSYRGVPLESVSGQPPSPNEVAIATKSGVASNGRCVDYLNFICHAGSEPISGDLVIELPDDDESLAQISSYRKNGDRLFSYEPHPHFPMWLNPFADFLCVASVQFERKQIPDRWLQASVTAAK